MRMRQWIFTEFLHSLNRSFDFDRWHFPLFYKATCQDYCFSPVKEVQDSVVFPT